jgi:murein DD-endopeptidase MepM/ murein hydrolase activator NlpD
VDKEKYTLLILSPTKGKIRELKVKKKIFWSLASLFLLLLVFGGFGIYQHIDTLEIRKRIRILQKENQDTEKKLLEVAAQLDSMRKQLVKLHDFDKKIRIIANLEQPPVQISGIGGVSPEEGILESIRRESRETRISRLRQQMETLQDLMEKQEISFRELEQNLKHKQKLLAHTPSIWPTSGWLTSGFGYRRSPFTGLKEFHKGLDIATKKGTPVIATGDGFVAEAGKDTELGKYIRIDHGFGFSTYYCHLAEILVKRGQRIKRGQIIGKVGNTGRSTGTHLHYEVRVNGLAVNPLRYILN